MGVWFVRIVTFLGLVGTVTGVPWFATLIWRDKFKTWFESHARPVLLVSCLVSLIVAWLVDRIIAAQQSAQLRPRHLEPESRKVIANALGPFGAQRLLLVRLEDTEAAQFSQQLQIEFGNAVQWGLFTATHEEARKVSGLRVEVSSTATKQEHAVAKALARCLKRLRQRVSGPKTVSGPFRFTLGRESFDLKIKLIVGSR